MFIQDAEGAKRMLISQAKGRIPTANLCVVYCGAFVFMGVLRLQYSFLFFIHF